MAKKRPADDDTDWRDRLDKATSARGQRTKAAKRMGRTSDVISKLVSGELKDGAAMMGASRAAGIAPPASLCDDLQQRLLKALEDVRHSVASGDAKSLVVHTETTARRLIKAAEDRAEALSTDGEGGHASRRPPRKRI